MSFKYIIILQQMYAILSNKRQRCYKKYNKKSANDCIPTCPDFPFLFIFRQLFHTVFIISMKQ